MPPRTFVPLTDPSLEPCPPDAVLIEYGRRAVLDERRTFDGVFDEALRLVQQREFYSMTELAAHFGHEPHWATRFKEAVLRQGLMSLEDFARCFTRRRDGRGGLVPGVGKLLADEVVNGINLIAFIELRGSLLHTKRHAV